MPNLKALLNKAPKWIFDLPFLTILIGIFFFLGYDKVLFLDPQGMHYSVQTDSLAFASQYFHHGFNFLEPQLYNLDSTDGKAASEFPILYFFTALLYTVFGENYFILKLINFTIAWSGIVALYKMSLILLKDYTFATLIPLFLLTSTVFNYYALNYLPDAAVIGFVFLGWHYYIKYTEKNDTSAIYFSVLFFTLAGLIKTSSLISLFTIISTAIILLLLRKEKLKSPGPLVLYGVVGISIIVLWNTYTFFYNIENASTYFTTSTRPIWDLSRSEVVEVFDYMNHYWYNKYFAHSSFHLLFAVFIFQAIFIAKSTIKMKLLTSLLFLGSLAYFSVYFIQFKEHDYYLIMLLPAIIWALVQGLSVFQKLAQKTWIIWVLKALFAVIVITGIGYSQSKLQDRYDMPMDDISTIGLMVKNELDSLNLPANAKILVVPDNSKNGTLLYLNRQGWTVNQGDQIDDKNLKSYQNKGANYVLVTTRDSILIAFAKNNGEIIAQNSHFALSKLSVR